MARLQTEHLSAEGQKVLQKGLREQLFPAGGDVIGKGAPVSGAWFVLAGRLRVYSLSPGGREASLYLINPGETCILALNSLFNSFLYPAWVQAVEDSRVGIIPGDVWRTLFRSEPHIQEITVSALSTVVFRLVEELEQVHSLRLDQRLASLVLARGDNRGVLCWTQQEIASHLGTTREVIARLVQGMSRQGLVRSGRGRIEILDRRGLQALLEDGSPDPVRPE